ncbi:MAG TPA: TRAP transporter TatT component family protein, partial [Thermoanaerobaculia bacterium]|nr:TRAP transporter TatT component family protein [Thermoanaerobaculia bacterium]
MAQFRFCVLLGLAALFGSACSIQRMAVDRLGDALAAGGTTYASDNDPQLVREALPFTLKLIESLLMESPNHEGMLVAAASGFSQYAYAFVQQDADRLAEEDFEAAQQELARARNLYLRARDYGLRALEVRHPGVGVQLSQDPEAALKVMMREDVPALYWTAAAWGLGVSVSKDQPEMVADLPIVEALIDRAFALDPSWNRGALHSFLINYEPARPGAGTAGYERATSHFEQAVALSEGKLASPYVTWAESVAIPTADIEGFRKALQTALAVDANAKPEWRLENLISQERAAWLLEREGELFLLEEEPEGDGE